MAITSADFDYLQRMVYDASAIVLEKGKEYLLESRLMPIAQKSDFKSIRELVAYLIANPSDRRIRADLIEAMTTNETLWFRDIHPFEALRKVVIPELIEQRSATRSLNIWSAACSTGQEPYSLAIMLRENFPELSAWNVRIVATDISPKVLARAVEGAYMQVEVDRGLSPQLKAKYFVQKENMWHVRPELKKILEFREINLTKAWPMMPTFDIVFIRNVLIYFDVDTKRAILQKIKKVMRPAGYLFLGAAETTVNIDDTWERVQSEKASYYRAPLNNPPVQNTVLAGGIANALGGLTKSVTPVNR